MHPVYFDNNATTPLHPRVREAMLPSPISEGVVRPNDQADRPSRLN